MGLLGYCEIQLASKRKTCALRAARVSNETRDARTHDTDWKVGVRRQRVSTRLIRRLHQTIADGRLRILLRKEVIQPHLPVRLPCYDFTPIANPTFERSLPKGLSHVLRVLSTFVV